jgi:prophage regulatory protein
LSVLHRFFLLPKKGDEMADDRLIRAAQVIGDKKKGIPGKIEISRGSLYQGIKDGKYPPGFLLGPRTRVWRESDWDEIIKNGPRKAA